MLRSYGWAVREPEKKLTYNLYLTGTSAGIALAVGRNQPQTPHHTSNQHPFLVWFLWVFVDVQTLTRQPGLCFSETRDTKSTNTTHDFAVNTKVLTSVCTLLVGNKQVVAIFQTLDLLVDEFEPQDGWAWAGVIKAIDNHSE